MNDGISESYLLISTAGWKIIGITLRERKTAEPVS